MALILEPKKTELHMQGEGWKVTTLADSSTIGSSAMVARRWSLDSQARTPLTSHGNYEEILYVISGSGEAVVGDQSFPLKPESILWLEAGDNYQLVAGETGLEILQGYAPGE